ncbi:hypothetical protein EI42_05728 [Thermosporothrix hazakensis]|jgi:hypothetical protein|uniref:Uncharacterized protein n=2 Tax=Thermosporothrix TaxID=768650 RepID=A0A326TXB9_THEHA|nr:hypothetical protein [Thermosporothrix hazakensis]PZW21073.1 hypothetical protein EI42_05728 [Thermosporothrix hazakensis]BBH88205.1 hypothetical protein KTC_29560 [Thermosporothrix sp. COM3]GCE46393.1 hypothetical protein KTH_12620 [Thermosporothrix hazakensis]
MMIERYEDGRPDPRAEEIQRNWRQWTEQNQYRLKESLPVIEGDGAVLIEVFEQQEKREQDQYLVFIPQIPYTSGDSEKLFLVNTEEQLHFLLDSLPKMIRVGIILARDKMQERRSLLN